METASGTFEMVARSDQPLGRKVPTVRSSPACTLSQEGLKPGGGICREQQGNMPPSSRYMSHEPWQKCSVGSVMENTNDLLVQRQTCKGADPVIIGLEFHHETLLLRGKSGPRTRLFDYHKYRMV